MIYVILQLNGVTSHSQGSFTGNALHCYKLRKLNATFSFFLLSLLTQPLVN